ncbi:hypothetical protein GALMADRAFT_214693 [Galerina marginata CBS 339.88]|uniref:Uncharacterized protein n=1 Tax=Galerina marginata (strain CBS 339.88) TaxID=685588 RepID=A0A067SU15_GALM3|nr:hypothetical protein GALMADRAFT_214693 [Galerina marginata CBS 339.88]
MFWDDATAAAALLDLPRHAFLRRWVKGVDRRCSRVYPSAVVAFKFLPTSWFPVLNVYSKQQGVQAAPSRPLVTSWTVKREAIEEGLLWLKNAFAQDIGGNSDAGDTRQIAEVGLEVETDITAQRGVDIDQSERAFKLPGTEDLPCARRELQDVSVDDLQTLHLREMDMSKLEVLQEALYPGPRLDSLGIFKPVDIVYSNEHLKAVHTILSETYAFSNSEEYANACSSAIQTRGHQLMDFVGYPRWSFGHTHSATLTIFGTAQLTRLALWAIAQEQLTVGKDEEDVAQCARKGNMPYHSDCNAPIDMKSLLFILHSSSPRKSIRISPKNKIMISGNYMQTP